MSDQKLTWIRFQIPTEYMKKLEKIQGAKQMKGEGRKPLKDIAATIFMKAVDGDTTVQEAEIFFSSTGSLS